MKPFNLEEAKAGAPVCTRDNHSVRIICWDAKDSDYPIVALVYYSDCGRDSVARYTLNGRNSKYHDTKYDLFMAEEEHYDISNLKPFDKVLVRDCGEEHWHGSLFSHYEIDEGAPFQLPFYTTSGFYTQCIPYNEETEHLIGTNTMPPKKYINW